MTLQPDESHFVHLDFLKSGTVLPAPLAVWSLKFCVFKWVVDKCSAICALPIILVGAITLFILNPFYNPGPLFYTQDRMGMGGKRFRMWKFRSMTIVDEPARHVDAPLEAHRVTALGQVMRKYRIDELPNFFNVLKGDMSLVGPRPDAWDHSQHYVSSVRHYGERFRVRPGITGLAQVYAGYADTARLVRRKAYLDRLYVRKSRIRLDLLILWRTLIVVLTGFGAR